MSFRSALRQRPLATILRLLWTSLLVAILVAAVLALALWLTGRVISDRYGWSQWLAWIPTPAALLAALLAVFATAMWRGWGRSLAAACACLLCIAGYFLFIEYRMFARPQPQPGGLRIVHWNPSVVGSHHDRYIEAMTHAGGDITVLTNAGSMPFRKEVWSWNDGPPIGASPFAIITRLDVVQRRFLVHEDDIVVLLLELDATEQLGRTLVMYIVDMPSELDLSRMDLARRARRMMDNAEAPPPDVVVGDFNMTRGSASIRTMFPDMRHAYDDAGAGYSATFRADRPLYHIDHVLLGRGMLATSYEVIDAGVGRHRMQRATITSR